VKIVLTSRQILLGVNGTYLGFFKWLILLSIKGWKMRRSLSLSHSWEGEGDFNQGTTSVHCVFVVCKLWSGYFWELKDVFQIISIAILDFVKLLIICVPLVKLRIGDDGLYTSFASYDICLRFFLKWKSQRWLGYNWVMLIIFVSFGDVYGYFCGLVRWWMKINKCLVVNGNKRLNLKINNATKLVLKL
jgi:hypothetical protein